MKTSAVFTALDLHWRLRRRLELPPPPCGRACRCVPVSLSRFARRCALCVASDSSADDLNRAQRRWLLLFSHAAAGRRNTRGGLLCRRSGRSFYSSSLILAGVLGSGGGVGPSPWVAAGEMMVRGVWPAAVPSPPGVGRPTPRTPWLSGLCRRPRGFCRLHIAPQLPAIMPPCVSQSK